MSATTYRRFIYELCASCAEGVYSTKAPSKAYAERVTSLMFMTMAHESAQFTATRQFGIPWEIDLGAWGLCQVERGSVIDSLKLLERTPLLADNAAKWVAMSNRAEIEPLLAMTPGQVLRMLPMSERLSVLFCRLHYLRVLAPVPTGIEACAEYAKRYYNTYAGKATPEDYSNAYRTAMSGIKEAA
jgi:hypothetical protein